MKIKIVLLTDEIRDYDYITHASESSQIVPLSSLVDFLSNLSTETKALDLSGNADAFYFAKADWCQYLEKIPSHVESLSLINNRFCLFSTEKILSILDSIPKSVKHLSINDHNFLFSYDGTKDRSPEDVIKILHALKRESKLYFASYHFNLYPEQTVAQIARAIPNTIQSIDFCNGWLLHSKSHLRSFLAEIYNRQICLKTGILTNEIAEIFLEYKNKMNIKLKFFASNQLKAEFSKELQPYKSEIYKS